MCIERKATGLFVPESFLFAIMSTEASSIMRALASARCTDARLYTYRIKIGTSQRAPGELSHY